MIGMSDPFFCSMSLPCHALGGEGKEVTATWKSLSLDY